MTDPKGKPRDPFYAARDSLLDALASTDLPSGALRVGIIIAKMMNARTWSASPSVLGLADWTKLHERTVQRAVAALRDAGILDIDDGGGRHRRHVFRLIAGGGKPRQDGHPIDEETPASVSPFPDEETPAALPPFHEPKPRQGCHPFQDENPGNAVHKPRQPCPETPATLPPELLIEHRLNTGGPPSADPLGVAPAEPLFITGDARDHPSGDGGDEIAPPVGAQSHPATGREADSASDVIRRDLFSEFWQEYPDLDDPETDEAEEMAAAWFEWDRLERDEPLLRRVIRQTVAFGEIFPDGNNTSAAEFLRMRLYDHGGGL